MFCGGINPCSFGGIKLWSCLCERRVKSLGQAAAAGLRGIEFGNQESYKGPADIKRHYIKNQVIFGDLLLGIQLK